MIKPFNRTILELKHEIIITSLIVAATFNRTILELKPLGLRWY